MDAAVLASGRGDAMIFDDREPEAAQRRRRAEDGGAWDMGGAMTGKRARARWGAAAVAAALTAMTATTPATAQEDFTCAAAVVVPDQFLQGYAQTRVAPGGGLEIALNDARGGIGLGQQTKEWLFARQCHLAGLAGDAPEVGRGGGVIFSLLEHREADCAAFAELGAKYASQPTAMTVVTRDIESPDFWDGTLGQFREVAPDAC